MKINYFNADHTHALIDLPTRYSIEVIKLLKLEHHVIKLALEQAKGRVSEAARLAGMSWQALTYAQKTRHKDLLKYRTPVRHRKRRQ